MATLGSYKNALQEYCQKRALPLPTYVTDGRISLSQIPLWVCMVTCNGKSFSIDEPCTTKRDAEQEAAKLACRYFKIETVLEQRKQFGSYDISQMQVNLNPRATPFQSISPHNEIKESPKHEQPVTHSPSQSLSRTLSPSLEASSDASKIVMLIDLENLQPVVSHIPENTIIYGFMSAFSTVSRNGVMTIYVVDSPVSEAADHYMTYITGKLVAKGDIVPNKDTIIIASRDKSSAVLVQLLKGDGFRVMHFKTAKEVEEYLFQLEN